MDFKKIGIDQIEDIFVDRVSTQIIDGSKRFSSQILAPSIKHKNALSQDAIFIGAADSAFGSSGSLDGVVYMYGGDYMVVSGPSIRFKITDDGSTIIGSDLSDYVSNDNEFQVVGKASFSDIATAPTAPHGTNTTQIATTAFVQANSRPYKVYTALLNQSRTSAPVATVLENTLGGTVVWARTSLGTYTGTLAGAFTLNKVGILFGSKTSPNHIVAISSDVNTITIFTNNSSGALTEGVLQTTTFEIKVYN